MPSPRLGICEFTTLPAPFEEDLAAYRAAGADAIGICEIKLEAGREREQLAAFRASGLAASACVPAVPSILPLPPIPGPEEPEERVQALVAGMRRLAPFQPAAIVCLTGPAGERSQDEARRVVLEGLRAVSEEAERLGLHVGLEPIHPSFRSEFTVISTLAETTALLDEVGSEALGITFDTWHLWDSPKLEEEIVAYGDRIVAVHVADWRRPTRGWCDRALPGEGAIDFGSLLRALENAGWEGAYDLEIFSDNGAFGQRYEDSLWELPAFELARRGRQSFLTVWQEALAEERA
ncbi:MAG: hypothetical protein C4305_01450 [Thermoleophilia bacterium]